MDNETFWNVKWYQSINYGEKNIAWNGHGQAI